MKNVLGANLKVVAGYKGTREINLAMQSGEAGGSCGMFDSTVRGSYAQDYERGDLVLFVQTATSATFPISRTRRTSTSCSRPMKKCRWRARLRRIGNDAAFRGDLRECRRIASWRCARRCST